MSSSHSSLDPLLSTRRSQLSAAVDLLHQPAHPASSHTASSASSLPSVGLARRMSPKLPPQSHPSSAAVTVSESRHSNGSAVGVPLLHSSLPTPHSAAAATSKSPLRFLALLLTSIGCVALLTVGWNHSALIRTPTLVCSDAHTCLPPHSLHTTPAPHTATTTATPTRTPTTEAAPAITAITPVPSPLRAPFHDSLASLLACPPLASILAANQLLATGETGQTTAIDAATQPKLHSLAVEYASSLRERLSASQLKFDDWRESDGRLTMARYYEQHSSVDLVTSSTRNTNYTISTWSNICLTFGGDKDPHLVLLGSDVEAQQRLIDTHLLTHDHQHFSWMPPRWCNDQGRLTAQAKANDDWLWIPAEDGTAAFHQFEVRLTAGHTQLSQWTCTPPHLVTSARFFDSLGCRALHTQPAVRELCAGWCQWDFNVGHQFHQQVWPLFIATQSESAQLFGSPTITRAMIDSSCRDDSSSMGVRHGAWKAINQVSQQPPTDTPASTCVAARPLIPPLTAACCLLFIVLVSSSVASCCKV